MKDANGSSGPLSELIREALQSMMRDAAVVERTDTVRHVLTVGTVESQDQSQAGVLILWNTASERDNKVATLAYLANHLIADGAFSRDEFMTEFMLRLHSPST